MSFNHYIDGQKVATYTTEKQTLKQRIERAKRARRDARLVMILTK